MSLVHGALSRSHMRPHAPGTRMYRSPGGEGVVVRRWAASTAWLLVRVHHVLHPGQQEASSSEAEARRVLECEVSVK